jgi:predicted DNA-binding protein
MVSQTVRLPEELASRLEALTATTRRSKSSLIVEAIERFVDEREDLEIALARFRDPDTEWVEHDDVRRELRVE